LDTSKKFTIVVGSVFGIILLACVGIMLYTKFEVGFPCLFHEITGQYCAGCGMTRAVVALSNMDFYQAIRYNVFVVIALPFLAIYFLVEGYYWVLNRKNRFEKVFQVIAVVILVGLVVYSVFRNIPAFSWLAPTDII